MTTKPYSIEIQKTLAAWKGRWSRMRPALAICFITALALRTQAANLTWDANGAAATPPNPADGNGDWLNGTSWWNGSSDQAWVNFNGAIFGTGSGTANAHTVTVSSPVLVTNLLFQTPGSYLVTGTQITLSNVVSAGLTVSPGVTAEVDSFISGPNGNCPAVTYTVGSGSLLTLGGGGTTVGGGGASWVGSSFSTSTLILNGGLDGPYQQQGSFHPDNITLDVTNGAIFNDVARLDLARNGTAVVNVSAGGQLNACTANGTTSDDTANLQISRGNPATLNVLNGGLISGFVVSGKLGGNLTILPDSSSRAILNVYPGATVKVGIGANGAAGTSSTLLRSIRLVIAQSATTYSANALAIANIFGGTVAAQNIIFGSASGVYTANPTNQLNVTGGTIYLDAANISQAVNTGTNFGISLSGGTIAATANWSPACSVPMNLTNVNGNITFQAADINGTSFNLPISGKLTGVGGLYKTGGGVLTLSGANTYSGLTVVSNGTLTIVTGGLPTNGDVIVDGSMAAGGLPINSVSVANSGQSWTIGNLTYAAGTPTADFSYGTLPPSTTVAAIQASGNVVCTVTPQIKVDGTAIPNGTYPLIHYGGSVSGTLPATAIMSSSATGVISNDPVTKTVYLVVSGSSVTPLLTWAVGGGLWDFATHNWLQFGSSAVYANGDSVQFDDTASGASPIIVTNNGTVQPGSVTFNNSSKAYVLVGNGAIAGSAGVDIKGTAATTLAGTNTYTGGTTIEAGAGPLNITYGGDNTAANSSIGTGPLTINLGGKIDNTSGAPLTLLANNAQFWNDDFIFAGSSSLNLGLGQVTLGSGSVNITVSNNTLTVNNQITDNDSGFGIGKAGAGTLTLANANTFSGGTTLSAGQLNLNNGGDGGPDSAIGSGTFTILGGIIDNTSGSTVTLQTPLTEAWNGSFVFDGTSSLDLGAGDINLNVGDVTLTVVSNSLSSEGSIGGHNKNIIKQGLGKFIIGGNLNDNNGLGVVVNAGEVDLNKVSNGSAHAIGVGTDGLMVNSNGLAVITGSGGDQINDAAPVQLSGGILDLNGQNETVISMTLTNGILRNGAPLVSQLNPWGGGVGLFALGGSYGGFDVTNGGDLLINFNITGSGTLLKTGGGTLTLVTNCTYTGDTVVNAGTLALVDPAAINNNASISIHTGAILDTTGLTNENESLTVFTGQTLRGNGVLNGGLVASAGSVVAPGTLTSVGTFTVNNSVMLAGNLFLKLNRTNAQTSDQLVSTTGTIAYGGTLSVSNSGPALQVGDTFQLFPSAVASFTGISLPTTDASGNSYTWNNNVAVNGSITVASVSSVNPLPGRIQFSLSGSTLSLSWPTNAGWLLQVQTNSLTAGLGTNWVTVPGSGSITSTNLSINPAVGAEFYRLTPP